MKMLKKGIIVGININNSNFAHGKHPVCLDKSA